MKRQIQTMTIFYSLAVILLAGCSGCGQTTTPDFKPPIATIPDGENRTATKNGTSDALPTEFSPPENPYQDITITGEAPPFDYYGDPVFWVPDLEYKIVGFQGQETSYPIIPDKDVDVYNARIKALEEERGEPLSRDEKNYISYEMRYGHLSPLDAVKAMYTVGIGSGSQYLLEVAQQALDANPNDFHTLLIWTNIQPYLSDSAETGYRQLLQMRPTHAYVLFWLGKTVRYKNREESIQLFKKAVQYAPSIGYGMASAKLSVHVRDWALQELAKAYFWEGEKQKSMATFSYLQQITKDDDTRERATKYIRQIKGGKRFGHVAFENEKEGGTANE